MYSYAMPAWAFDGSVENDAYRLVLQQRLHFISIIDRNSILKKPIIVEK